MTLRSYGITNDENLVTVKHRKDDDDEEVEQKEEKKNDNENGSGHQKAPSIQYFSVNFKSMGKLIFVQKAHYEMKVGELKKLFYVQEIDENYDEHKTKGMTFLCHEEFMHDERTLESYGITNDRNLLYVRHDAAAGGS